LASGSTRGLMAFPKQHHDLSKPILVYAHLQWHTSKQPHVITHGD